jgi:bifunctional DNA primase/polymerase-like protein/primase-like protein
LSDPLAAAALDYAAREWPVFPLQTRTKIPLKGTRGFKDATTDRPSILETWKANPGSNIGIRTGRASSLLVLDVDPAHGGDDALFHLEQNYGTLPATVEAITGSGGRHIYFASRQPIRNSAGRLGAGLDVRGEGGYVVAPPSRLTDGGSYVWESSYHPDDHSPVAPPAWLLAALQRPVEVSATDSQIPEGRRNATLTRQAGFLALAGFNPDAIAAALAEQNRTVCDPPLEADEVRRIAANAAIWRAGPPWLTRPAMFLASIPPTLKPATRMVLMVLVACSKADGRMTLSLSRIGDLAGMTKAAVAWHIGQLAAAGYIERGSTGKRGTRYRLNAFGGV